jgi:hypothetical protein
LQTLVDLFGLEQHAGKTMDMKKMCRFFKQLMAFVTANHSGNSYAKLEEILIQTMEAYSYSIQSA